MNLVKILERRVSKENHFVFTVGEKCDTFVETIKMSR